MFPMSLHNTVSNAWHPPRRGGPYPRPQLYTERRVHINVFVDFSTLISEEEFSESEFDEDILLTCIKMVHFLTPSLAVYNGR